VRRACTRNANAGFFYGSAVLRRSFGTMGMFQPAAETPPLQSSLS